MKRMDKICARCKYEWEARKEKPRACPNCKRQIDYTKKGKIIKEGELPVIE